MDMPFIDLAAQQSRIYDRIEENIKKVLSHGQYIMGPEVGELEERLADFVDVKFAIGCSSGTDALLMALMAHDVGPGDAVFTTPFTFVATAETISLTGATPVFVDIEPDTFNIDPGLLAQTFDALEKMDPDIYPLPAGFEGLKPRGIVAVDLFGQCADYDRIISFARDRGLFVIEDAAQSLGAEYHGRKAGSLADCAATSFFPAKPLGAYGDGGMVFTADAYLAEKLYSIRVHGKGSHKYENLRLGLNGRLDTIQAAILIAKFEIFPEEIELRQEVAARYTELLGQSGVVSCPKVKPGLKSAWAQYSLVSEHRDTILGKLKASGIPTAIYYPIPLHFQGAYRHLGYKKGDFPMAEKISRTIFSIPMHPYMKPEDQRLIAEIILDSV